MDMQTWRDGHMTAEQATSALRDALAALGLPERAWEALRPVVTYNGTPYVHMGMVRADVAERMAEAMRARQVAR